MKFSREKSHKKHFNDSGMTLIEILITVTIVGLLGVASLVYVTPSLNRGRDSRRKSDMHKIANLLEEYYNDKGTYPNNGAMTACGKNNLALNPYLKDVPCEPNTSNAFYYVATPVGCSGTESSRCAGYRLFTILKYSQDPDIKKLGCDDDDGCHKALDGRIFTYGVSKGIALED